MKAYTLHFSFRKRVPLKYKWARIYWKFLYTLASHYPKAPLSRERIGYEQFIYTFINVIPCNECKTHYYNYVKSNPPDLKSNSNLYNWVKKLQISM